MVVELVHVGFDNFIVINRIVAIASLNTTSIKRVIKEAGAKGLLIDMTHGRKTRSAIVTDTGHIFLASRAPEIIAARLPSGRGDSVLRVEQSDEKGES
ncbi:extracellular matrix/biofilm biosynthesis regulator RemA family protein [Chloroflexota bacterium]